MPKCSRRSFFAAGVLLATAALRVPAVTPPAYLGVKDFDKCLAEKDMGGYRAWCLPAHKPAACPAHSWKALNALTGDDQVPGC